MSAESDALKTELQTLKSNRVSIEQSIVEKTSAAIELIRSIASGLLVSLKADPSIQAKGFRIVRSVSKKTITFEIQFATDDLVNRSDFNAALGVITNLESVAGVPPIYVEE